MASEEQQTEDTARLPSFLSPPDERLAQLQARAPCFTFEDGEAKALATAALTHSSCLWRRNNVELARVGDASGKIYEKHAQTSFATRDLAPIARRLGLQDLLRLGRGTSAVSDEMCARVLLALLGVLDLTVGEDAVLRAITELGILDLPPVALQGEDNLVQALQTAVRLAP
ncbi:hypothetical protein JCM8202_003010 [Rhodotorula sphaerocarpa]